MLASAYGLIAQVRFRELKTRVALAAFIGVVAAVMTRSAWPAVWFAAVLATQAIDWLVWRSQRLHPESQPTRGMKALYCAVAFLTVTVYSGITAFLWFQGGEAGRLFAMVQTAGGLLHVSLHMHHSRAVLISAVIPHSLYFLGLPIVGAIISGQPWEFLIALGGVLYMMHLVVAVRQSSHTTAALRQANHEAREARRRAEVASAAKSDFLAVISHEIRTPMNAVISAANLLRRTRLDAGQREHVAMLMDAGDVLVGLLNDVLDFSKIEAGRMTFETAEVNLADKLASLRRLWAPKAEANGVRLLVRIAPGAPEVVLTDPLRLQQMMFNLLSNAVKFTQEGRIDVTAGWDEARGRLTLAVRDTGIGIAPDRLAHIFRSFEQADVGTTRRFGGTGLGLTISRRLAEIMGGDLTVESVVGEGSLFTLSLPVERVETSQGVEAEASMPAVSLTGRRILAADDHEVNRRILALLLEPHGCRLTFVVNGAEAVEAAAAEPFDAILMDMQMPIMDGLEATRRIRQGGPNARTPVVALTANAMDVHKAAWDAAKVHAFLTKPIDPPLLARTLSEACAVSAAQAEAA